MGLTTYFVALAEVIKVTNRCVPVHAHLWEKLTVSNTLVRESDEAIVSLCAALWESIVQVRP